MDRIITIKDPGDLRDSSIARALRGEKVPTVCVLRTEKAAVLANQPWTAVRLEDGRRLHGAQVPIKLGQTEIGVATIEVRRDGLYFTSITPTPAGIEWSKNPRVDMPPIPFGPPKGPHEQE